jgi:hypothetical protein
LIGSGRFNEERVLHSKRNTGKISPFGGTLRANVPAHALATFPAEVRTFGTNRSEMLPPIRWERKMVLWAI